VTIDEVESIDEDELDELILSLGVVVGERLNEFRTSVDLTVAELAEMAGVSKGMLSKIENSQASPSLQTLAKLSKALHVPITAFFRGLEESHDALHVRANEGFDVSRSTHDDEWTMQLVGIMRGQHQRMEPVIVAIDEPVIQFPLYQHPGTELLYVIEGTVEYGYGSSKYVLRPGDTLQFHGEVSHGPTRLIDLPIKYLSVKAYGDVRGPRPADQED
jgi:transcriptional regulator with XRE-family HTH domain